MNTGNWMKLNSYLFVFLLLTVPNVALLAQADSVAQRIILIGDAGQQTNNQQPELELARKLFPMDKKTTVLYLGDNIYPQGLPSYYASDYEKRRQVLDSQINLVRGTQARAFFIPGNHDWAQGRAGGYQQVTNQSRYIVSQGLQNVQFIPFDVCPGPEEIQLSDKITLVAIDSQWWLHQHEKSGVTYGCDVQSQEDMLESLKEIIDRNEDKIVIFAAHHPFITYGRHGGYYNLKQHVFPLTDINPKLWIPLPIIGSLYPISRGVFGNIQDTRHPIYKNFSSSVDSILNQHPYCIRVAGHEHTLQFIKDEGRYYIVSGAGSKMTELAKADNLVFGASQTGFGVIEIIKNGHVNVSFYSTMADSSAAPIFSAPLPAWDTTPHKPKIYERKTFKDSVMVVANPKYKAGKSKQWWLGKNYRDEWTTPIKVKVFDISKEKNGLKVVRQGGGMQTKSLRLTDTKGNEYSLRSVEKFPDNTLPEEFRETFVKDAVVDGISASYPFAALSIPVLSEAADVPYAKPRLVFIPDDPQLGYYRDEFKNKLAIFEEREPGGFSKNISTEKVLDKLRDDNDNSIDQKAVLKARLLDMFIMDFDRHEDQWRWATNDTGEKKTYVAIPRDRDQAFFINNGFIPKQVAKPYRMPKFQGFRKKAININTFNFNARYFDRTFLNQMTTEEWVAATDELINEMTDKQIEKALAQQPKEIYKFSAPTIIKTLKERRKFLKEDALTYYKFLAQEVDITGSDKREFFNVMRNDDGSVDVTVRKIKKEGDLGDT
ncbi:MAG TPA: metallophosphoesterase, partial [Flavitalea sp.]|nr:metallophosphoesterase [Flavitalea sp.]